MSTILILGGGPPTTPESPPTFVIPRIEKAASLYHSSSKKPKLVCLSAGTAHLPPLMCPSPSGPPIYESTSCSSLLTTLDVPTESIYVETWSYDTIGNAYAALHHFVALQPHIFGTDITVITSQFHITRTRIIFDWVFPKEYNLSYISVDDEGVDETALSARYKRESDSIEGMKKAIEKWGDNIFEFITQEHDLYSAKGLMERSQCKGGGSPGGSP